MTSWRSAPASSSIASFFEVIRGLLEMTIALTAPIVTKRRFFLGVERSACGRAWCDRLDERGAARALAIAQRYADMPEFWRAFLPAVASSSTRSRASSTRPCAR